MEVWFYNFQLHPSFSHFVKDKKFSYHRGPCLICLWIKSTIILANVWVIPLSLRFKPIFPFFTLCPYTQTQPVPNPMSYYMHHFPWWFHRFETLSNHLIELVFPFFTFLGRRMCMVNGAIQILFQVMLWLGEKINQFNVSRHVWGVTFYLEKKLCTCNFTSFCYW